MEFTKDIQFNNSPTVNKSVTIDYSGFLSNSSELSIVYGFGESWEFTSETKMEKFQNGFTAKIKMLDFDTFNFCFKNSYNEWDNNCNCNYISPVLPCIDEKVQFLFDELTTPEKEEKTTKTFDINELIEEILEPILIQSTEEQTSDIPVQISTQPIDLGIEISNVLSQIVENPTSEELIEYSTLDEILTCSVIDQKPVELFDEETAGLDEVVNELIKNMSISQETSQNTTEEIHEDSTQKSLIPLEDAFMISPRQLSKFYLFKKRLKLAFYKALVKIPKMIFGEENT